MSFSRWDGWSAIYVYEHVHGGVTCASCGRYWNVDELLTHLKQHVERGENVYQHLLDPQTYKDVNWEPNYTQEELDGLAEMFAWLGEPKKEDVDDLVDGVADSFWSYADKPDECPKAPHRPPEGPNEELSQCMLCSAISFTRRPAGEEYYGHIADCSLPRDHLSYCKPGGAGHPKPEKRRGHFPEEEQ